MVKFFKPQPKEVSNKHFSLMISDIDLRGRGVAKLNNVTWFVEGALLGEEVIVRAIDLKKNIGEAELISVKKRANDRLSPKCSYFGKCGGCSLQHMSSSVQLENKEQGLRRLFKKVVNIDLPSVDSVCMSNDYCYRRVCRVSVLGNKKEIQFGFREAYGTKIVEIDHCEILDTKLSNLLTPLRQLLENLSNYKIIGHVELYSVDSGVVVLFRTINSLSASDKELCKEFSEKHDLQIYVIERHLKGKEDLEDKEELYCLSVRNENPYYMIDDLKIAFTPGAFIQVNPKINQDMISKCIDYLDLTKEDVVLDLFCGIGNFTLPIAKYAKNVIGIEGVGSMVNEAKENALLNNLNNAEFFIHDLDDDFEKTRWAKDKVTKVCLDPGRKGAQKVISYLIKKKIDVIVYISCNPLTFVRDLDDLIKNGYEVKKWSIFNMFPNTEHIESMYLIERKR